ncbi:MAG: cytochrome c [Maricaulaceae bacterium]|jgi:mono/diheme cytochrome c family protein
MLKRALIGVAAIIIVGGIVLFALAWRPTLAPIDPPAASDFSADVVERGAQLAAAGNCASCHTADNGAFAGGYAIETDFGTIYSTNITPHPDSGIGRWSQDAFARALRDGVRRDGAQLLPAMPYTHFTLLSDEDVGALYAYFMTIDPVDNTPSANELPFPYSVRALQGGWKLLNFSGGTYAADPDKDDVWNRGAYLAEGLGHCAACHSPRNGLGAVQDGAQAYAGNFINGWYAPAINADPDAPLPWTADDLEAYLRTGASPLHGVAVGSMSEVVHEGLAALPDDDVRAIAVYLSDRFGAPEAIPAEEIAAASMAAGEDELGESEARGRQLYVSYCASCHFNRPGAPSELRPELALNSAITGPDPTMFLHAVLEGVSIPDGHPSVEMPAFDFLLTDQDVADIAAYLRAVYADGSSGDWANLAARVEDHHMEESH